MPVYHVGDVIQKLMRTHQPPLNNGELAQQAGLRPTTVSDVLRSGRAEDVTLEKIARVLKVTTEEMRRHRDALNSADTNIHIVRTGKDRDEDKDPIMAEAMQYARRLARLPLMARMTVYNVVAAFEDILAMTDKRQSS